MEVQNKEAREGFEVRIDYERAGTCAERLGVSVSLFLTNAVRAEAGLPPLEIDPEEREKGPPPTGDEALAGNGDHAKLEAAAASLGLTMGGFIERAVKRAIERHEAGRSPTLKIEPRLVARMEACAQRLGMTFEEFFEHVGDFVGRSGATVMVFKTSDDRIAHVIEHALRHYGEGHGGSLDIDLDPELTARVEACAARVGKSARDFAREALNDHLSRRHPPGARLESFSEIAARAVTAAVERAEAGGNHLMG